MKSLYDILRVRKTDVERIIKRFNKGGNYN